MFRPTPMKKINAMVLSSKKDEVLRRLMEGGVIEFSDVSLLGGLEAVAPTQIRAEASELLSRVEAILKIFDQVQPPNSSFLSFGGAETEKVRVQKMTPQRLFEEARDKLFRVGDRVINISSRLDAIAKEREELAKTAEILGVLAKLGVGPKELKGYTRVQILVGTISNRELEDLREDIEAIVKERIFYHQPIDMANSILLVGFMKGYEIEVSKVLRIHRFEELKIPARFLSETKEALGKIDAELAELQKEETEIRKEIKQIATEERASFLALKELLEIEKFLDEAKSNFGKTKDTYAFVGWVPHNNIDKAVEVIREASEGYCVVHAEDPKKDEKPPSLLRNPASTESMELLTETYGSPDYREIDPTSFMAVTFPLVFGLMFGDVGQGVLVLLAGYLMRFRLRLGAGPRKLGGILMLCGLFAIMAGFLYGSVFGLEGEHLKRYLGVELHPLWLSPTENPGALIGFGLKLGVFLLISACALNIANEISHKKFFDAFVSPYGLAGIWILVGGVMVVSKHASNVPGAFADLPLLLPAIVAPFLIMTLGEKFATGISLPMAAFEAWENISRYLVNSVSYIRVVALAIIHGALNLIMVLMMDASGSVVLTALIFLVGNIGIFAMEMFVSFIQTMRLHYYEWFSKFFSGDGKKFTPFSIERKYTIGGE